MSVHHKDTFFVPAQIKVLIIGTIAIALEFSCLLPENALWLLGRISNITGNFWRVDLDGGQDLIVDLLGFLSYIIMCLLPRNLTSQFIYLLQK